jgi:hypothetical protein
MSRVGFEPTIPAFESAKTVHVLDLAAIVIGSLDIDSVIKQEVICIVNISWSYRTVSLGSMGGSGGRIQ